jgi:hypothetical protein
MLADFFTKPLQGNLFTKFKRVLMGHAHIDTLGLSTQMPIEERVENNGKHMERSGTIGTNVQQPQVRAVSSSITGSTSTGDEEGWIVVQNKRNKNKVLESRAKKDNVVREQECAHSLELIQLRN